MATQQQKTNSLFLFGLIFFFLGWVVFPDLTRELGGFNFSPFIVAGFLVYFFTFVRLERKEIKDIFGF